jgi:FkbM family methyltransferase
MISLIRILAHTFSPSLITGRPPTVIDCGANEGAFARWCAENLHARVLSYEADPAVAAALPAIPGVTFFNMAVAGLDGSVQVRSASGTCSSIRYHEQCATATATVDAVSLRSILSRNGLEFVDLLKLDIEGAELDVLELATPETLSRFGQITCEFHDFIDARDLPRIRGVLTGLRKQFVVIPMSFTTYGDVLMINRALLASEPLAVPTLWTHKYFQGGRRALRRLTRA